MKSKRMEFSTEDVRSLLRSAAIWFGPQLILSLEQLQNGSPLNLSGLFLSIVIDGLRRYLKDNSK